MRKARVDTFSLKIAFLLRNKSNQRSDEAMAVFRVEKNKGYCGSPIQYANINSSYWQTHFYAFGRL